MTLPQKAMERIANMSKGQVLKAIQDVEDGLGNPATLDALNARMLKLAPPAPTPFPRQAELNEAYAQIRMWSDAAKELIKEARAGNHTFANGDGETVKPARSRKATTTTTGKATTTTTGKAQIVIGANTYVKWSQAANGEGVRPDLSRAVTRNWRPEVMEACTGKVVLTGVTPEEYAAAFPIPEGCKWTYIAAEEVKAE